MKTELVGYADRLSVQGGEEIEIKVSTDLALFEASIVQLFHGDENGPGFKEAKIADCGTFPGRKQIARPGSYVLLDRDVSLDAGRGLSVAAWIYPTAPGLAVRQGIWTHASKTTGYSLFIENGRLAFGIQGPGNQAIVRSEQDLRKGEWHFIVVTYRPGSGTVHFYQRRAGVALSSGGQRTAAVPAAVAQTEAFVGQVTLAAMCGCWAAGSVTGVSNSYNGKLEDLAVFRRALEIDEIDEMNSGGIGAVLPDVLAAWDFSVGISGSAVLDRGPEGLTGTTVNNPMRAAVGHNWTGDEISHVHAPDQYGAIHFHDDDLEDAGWETDFVWSIPVGCPSGIYAVRLSGDGEEDYVPFFVRPDPAAPAADVVLLLPTMTYLAYANEASATFESRQEMRGGDFFRMDEGDLYLRHHPELGNSLYDHHSDGSGVCYSTARRPIINMRPKYRQWQFRSPRHLGADLYIVDWLKTKSIPYHVITDHDLHSQPTILDRYKVMITGTHPEYWTSLMRSAVEQYHERGGRQLYLGGNGYYWVTSVDAQKPHIVEVRRGLSGTRAWTSHPGELFHSTTGELGGLWRHRGKPPNALVGIGFRAMGDEAPVPGFRRCNDSFDSRVAFIFEGIGADEVIGDFGLVLGGASGDEIDCLDYSRGSPSDTFLLATATGHPNGYAAVVEDLAFVSDITLAEQAANVRADMVYRETPNGGAVFSVGAISWCGSLSHNGYDNNVSRITENVLRHFLVR